MDQTSNDNWGGTYIGLCTDCGSDQPAKYMEGTTFDKPPCKFCGGVVHIIPYTGEENRNNYLARQRAGRGLNEGRNPGGA